MSELTDPEVTAKEELFELAEVLHDADKMEKTGKAAKEQIKPAFFELISEVVRDEIPLARQTVEVETTEEFDAQEWRARNYPEWRIVAIDAHPEGLTVTLEENEAFKKYEFTHDGFRYGRQIRMKDGGFDAEGFAQRLRDITDEELGEVEQQAIRAALQDCVSAEIITVYSVDEKALLKVMNEWPETVALIQEYTVPGRPEVALLPIKAAKEEEE